MSCAQVPEDSSESGSEPEVVKKKSNAKTISAEVEKEKPSKKVSRKATKVEEKTVSQDVEDEEDEEDSEKADASEESSSNSSSEACQGAMTGAGVPNPAYPKSDVRRWTVKGSVPEDRRLNTINFLLGFLNWFFSD